MTESKGDNHHFWIGRLADRMPDHKSSLVITDPPYNRNFKYGEGVNDNLPRAETTTTCLSTPSTSCTTSTPRMTRTCSSSTTQRKARRHLAPLGRAGEWTVEVSPVDFMGLPVQHRARKTQVDAGPPHHLVADQGQSGLQSRGRASALQEPDRSARDSTSPTERPGSAVRLVGDPRGDEQQQGAPRLQEPNSKRIAASHHPLCQRRRPVGGRSVQRDLLDRSDRD